MSWEVFDEKFLEYDKWFDTKGKIIYLSELKALEKIFETDDFEKPIFELGVGTGRFSLPLNIKYGIEPSEKMSKIAKKRGIKVVRATAENLPFKDESIGTILLIVTICFLDNFQKSFTEIKRVLKKEGDLIIGFVPKDSEWGKFYLEKKRKNHLYYKNAQFYNFAQIKELLDKTGFGKAETISTLTIPPQNFKDIQFPISGYDKQAGFIIIKAKNIN